MANAIPVALLGERRGQRSRSVTSGSTCRVGLVKRMGVQAAAHLMNCLFAFDEVRS